MESNNPEPVSDSIYVYVLYILWRQHGVLISSINVITNKKKELIEVFSSINILLAEFHLQA